MPTPTMTVIVDHNTYMAYADLRSYRALLLAKRILGWPRTEEMWHQLVSRLYTDLFNAERYIGDRYPQLETACNLLTEIRLDGKTTYDLAGVEDEDPTNVQNRMKAVYSIVADVYDTISEALTA